MWARLLVTGDFQYDNRFLNEFERWDYNTTVQLADAVQCSVCYAQFDFDVHFTLDLADYQLNDLSLVAEGAVGTLNNLVSLQRGINDLHVPKRMIEFNVGAKLYAEESWSNSSSLPITTVAWNPIAFTIGVVPFVLQISVPISETWTLAAEGSIDLEADLNAQGSVQYGIKYNKEASSSR
jgi:hypothetical protein